MRYPVRPEESLTTEIFNHGVRRVNEIMSPPGHPPVSFMSDGLTAVLSALVFGLWTTCEVCLTNSVSRP